MCQNIEEQNSLLSTHCALNDAPSLDERPECIEPKMLDVSTICSVNAAPSLGEKSEPIEPATLSASTDCVLNAALDFGLGLGGQSEWVEPTRLNATNNGAQAYVNQHVGPHHNAVAHCEPYHPHLDKGAIQDSCNVQITAISDTQRVKQLLDNNCTQFNLGSGVSRRGGCFRIESRSSKSSLTQDRIHCTIALEIEGNLMSFSFSAAENLSEAVEDWLVRHDLKAEHHYPICNIASLIASGEPYAGSVVTLLPPAESDATESDDNDHECGLSHFLATSHSTVEEVAYTIANQQVLSSDSYHDRDFSSCSFTNALGDGRSSCSVSYQPMDFQALYSFVLSGAVLEPYTTGTSLETSSASAKFLDLTLRHTLSDIARIIPQQAMRTIASLSLQAVAQTLHPYARRCVCRPEDFFDNEIFHAEMRHRLLDIVPSSDQGISSTLGNRVRFLLGQVKDATTIFGQDLEDCIAFIGDNPRTMRAVRCIMTTLQDMETDQQEFVGRWAWETLLSRLFARGADTVCETTNACSTETSMSPSSPQKVHLPSPSTLQQSEADAKRTPDATHITLTPSKVTPGAGRNSSRAETKKTINYDCNVHPQDNEILGLKRFAGRRTASKPNKKRKHSN